MASGGGSASVGCVMSVLRVSHCVAGSRRAPRPPSPGGSARSRGGGTAVPPARGTCRGRACIGCSCMTSGLPSSELLGFPATTVALGHGVHGLELERELLGGHAHLGLRVADPAALDLVAL